MSHDRGCSCGLERYETEDCRKKDCPYRKFSSETVTRDILNRFTEEKRHARKRKVLQDPDAYNCVQCCVATLLDIPLNHVPDFVKISEGQWLNSLRDWLESTGYELHVIDGYSARLGY